MKSILTLLVITSVLFYTAEAYSQEKETTKKEVSLKSSKQQNYYIEKLNLNEKQAKRFEAINETYKKRVSAMKIKSKSKKSVKKLKALENERDNQIKELLSEEKFKEYLKLRKVKRNSLKTLIRKSNGQ